MAIEFKPPQFDNDDTADLNQVRETTLDTAFGLQQLGGSEPSAIILKYLDKLNDESQLPITWLIEDSEILRKALFNQIQTSGNYFPNQKAIHRQIKSKRMHSIQNNRSLNMFQEKDFSLVLQIAQIIKTYRSGLEFQLPESEFVKIMIRFQIISAILEMGLNFHKPEIKSLYQINLLTPEPDSES